MSSDIMERIPKGSEEACFLDIEDARHFREEIVDSVLAGQSKKAYIYLTDLVSKNVYDVKMLYIMVAALRSTFSFRPKLLSLR